MRLLYIQIKLNSNLKERVNVMKAIVLTAGPGTKLEPLTDHRPKALLPICGRTVMSRHLLALSQIGIQDVAVVVNPRYPDPVSSFQDTHMPSLSVFRQTETPGIGNGVLAAKSYISKNDYFLLAYGDILFSDNMFKTLVQSFNRTRKPVASVCLTGNSSDFGIIYMDHQMRINKIIEKPKSPNLGNYILAGAFILPGTFLDILEARSGSIIDAFRCVLDDAGLYASIWEGDWVDITYPWSLLTANQMVMSQWKRSSLSTGTTIEPGATVSGAVIIEEGTTVKAGASILGPCYIGRNCFIGHNALLRDNTCIGDNSIIGFGVEVKNSVLMPGTEIGRLSFIGDSILGENVNLGSASILVNINMDRSTVKVSVGGQSVDSGFRKLGSFIGDNSWIGANHTFLPGTKIASGQIIPHFGTYPQT
jgi:UDP-N-acetylglucosamine diphosphorylase / glucose-1-phosphate thymidylyltransferase / UDP-N-acetylgalactosamine diphosphorylase / glucosamine-1-phosphate N-acetyltransferase / galactosamine-1-phosphate N-acetyltransferase